MGTEQIYYLPGRGGRLQTGLGKALTSSGLSVSGRETVGDFVKLSFQEQIELVAQDLKDHFWSESSRVIANSFGAYLFLQAQTLLPPYIGKVLLLSPIVGEFSSNETGTHFIPPRSGKLKKLAQEGRYPAPAHCEIHVGELDWQSDPASVSELGRLLELPVTVVPKAGHMLPKEYVGGVLDQWLSND